MTDRELLTLAAKAAGIRLEWITLTATPKSEAQELPFAGDEMWDPLADDCAALRLLARLRLTLDYRPGFVGVHKGFSAYIGQCPHDEDNAHDTAPTRRAIVLAAASVGKAMP